MATTTQRKSTTKSVAPKTTAQKPVEKQEFSDIWRLKDHHAPVLVDGVIVLKWSEKLVLRFVVPDTHNPEDILKKVKEVGRINTTKWQREFPEVIF